MWGGYGVLDHCTIAYAPSTAVVHLPLMQEAAAVLRHHECRESEACQERNQEFVVE